MVITEHVLSQVGPAISSGNSMLVYGKPGDGKTYLIESLNNLEASPVFVPHAIDCQGNIVRVFDPVYHERLDEEKRFPSRPSDATRRMTGAGCAASGRSL